MTKTTDTEALSAAIKEFEAALPGWWWTVGHCNLSRHASCGPDVQGQDHKYLDIDKFDKAFTAMTKTERSPVRCAM